jgi:type I restriction enzyme S subunit
MASCINVKKMDNNYIINNFKHLTTTPGNVEQLKKLVLQMAVQGKLTEKWREGVKTQGLASHDDPNYNAHALLEKIEIEKEQLIKEGKIKRQKPLWPVSDEEKPFILPNSWEWCRMSQAGLFARGKSKHRPRNDKTLFENGTIPFVQTGDVAQSKKFNYRIEKCTSFYNEIGLAQSSLWRKNTLCITIAANIAFTGFLDFDACFPDSVVGFTSLVGTDLSKYLRFFIELTKEDIEQFAPATAQKNINLAILNELIIPLPSLAEQKAIVFQVEKLFTQIDQLHALAQKRLNYREKSAKALFSKVNNATNDAELQETWQTLTAHFHTLSQSKESVKQLRQSILQMAVQGKLTAKWRKENPDIETAGVLLEKIEAENEQVKSRYNLRKQKTLLEITEEEKAFPIPQSWSWFRIGKLLFTTSGGTPTRGNTEYWDGKIPWLKSGELTGGLITLAAQEKITELGHKKSSTNLFPKDTLLIALYGATAGKLGILTYPSTTNQAICGFYANSNIETDYLFYYLWAFRSKILSDSWGQAQPNISQDYLKKFCFALPPHEEQKAIVSKVKQLMTWCDELDKKIEKRDAYQEKMMQAVVKQAFKTEKETVEME